MEISYVVFCEVMAKAAIYQAYKERWNALLGKEMPYQKEVSWIFAKFLDVKTQQRGRTCKGVVNCFILLMPK